ncbi:MAG: hypothetical protein U0V64_14665 [Cyclobacteriaceae bacterium]
MAGLLAEWVSKTFVSAKGSDRGKGHRRLQDGLGLESRVIVEVEGQEGQHGCTEIRVLSVPLGLGDGRSIYLSTGGSPKKPAMKPNVLRSL